MPMTYPATLSADLQYLAAYYQWDANDKIEIRAAFTDSEPMVRYFTILAAAHRAGYAQHAGNGFVRLQAWCVQHGLPDPFTEAFDPALLDALQVEGRSA